MKPSNHRRIAHFGGRIKNKKKLKTFGAMEELIGISFFFALWLTFLTMKLRDQQAKNKALEKNNKFYLKELRRISDEQEEAKKTNPK